MGGREHGEKNWKIKTERDTWDGVKSSDQQSSTIVREGVPAVVQRKQIQLGTMRSQVRSLGLLSGLKIWRCHELECKVTDVVRILSGCGCGCGWQLQLQFDPQLGNLHMLCVRRKKAQKKQKKKKKKREEKNEKNYTLRHIHIGK